MTLRGTGGVEDEGDSATGGASSKSRDPHKAFRSIFALGKVLGTGGFGEVRHAIHRETGEQVAVKIIMVPEGRRGQRLHQSVLQEVLLHQKLSHKNIIRMREVYQHGHTFYLVTDYAPGGELLESLVASRVYKETEARHAFWELCEGVSYIHSQGIVHRDLKLENLLLDNSRTSVRIADFGLAAEIDGPPLNNISGSMLYVAPEILRCKDDPDASYDHRVDLWSIGVALFILLTGRAPFDSPDAETHFSLVSEGRVEFRDAEFGSISRSAQDLIRRLLTVDADQRISLSDVFAHSWLAPLAARKARRRTAPSGAVGGLDGGQLGGAGRPREHHMRSPDALVASASLREPQGLLPAEMTERDGGVPRGRSAEEERISLRGEAAGRAASIDVSARRISSGRPGARTSRTSEEQKESQAAVRGQLTSDALLLPGGESRTLGGAMSGMSVGGGGEASCSTPSSGAKDGRFARFRRSFLRVGAKA